MRILRDFCRIFFLPASSRRVFLFCLRGELSALEGGGGCCRVRRRLLGLLLSLSRFLCFGGCPFFLFPGPGFFAPLRE